MGLLNSELETRHSPAPELSADEALTGQRTIEDRAIYLSQQGDDR